MLRVRVPIDAQHPEIEVSINRIRSMRKALVLSFALFALANRAHVQQPAPAGGLILGRVVDAATGAGLTAVTVQVVGTPLGTVSGLDGRYIINNVPAGRVALRAMSLGYATKSTVRHWIG